ncbi:MAG: hypothetical protein AB1468_04520 [Candidatus Micrarchaeota archaeon]
MARQGVKLVLLLAGALLAVVVLALAHFLIFGWGGGGEKPPAKPPVFPNITNQTNGTPVVGGACEKLEGLARDLCYLDESANKSVAACEKIVNISVKDRCVYNFAMADPFLCESISESAYKDACYYDAAKRKNSSLLCAGILNESFKAECREFFRVKTPCDEIADKYNQTLCLALLNNNASLCADSGNPDECYFAYAKNRTSRDACGGIVAESARHACYAVVRNWVHECDAISIEYNASRDGCYVRFAQEMGDPTACVYAVNALYINECYQSLAVALNQPVLCAQCVTEFDRDACYAAVALKNSNVLACANIVATEKRDVCRIDIAKARSNPLFCSYVESDYFRNDFCYKKIIMSGEYEFYPIVCENIGEQYWKDRCYNTVAIAQRKPDLCRSISEESIKNTCIEKASAG